MKKEYNGAKAEKVEFNYEENVVASGRWEGNLEFLNDTKCICRYVEDKKDDMR